MKIAIHHTESAHPDSFSRKWIEYLPSRDIEPLVLDFKQSNTIEQIRGCAGAMWHWFHTPDDKQAAPKILDAIEFGLRLPVFPNRQTRWHYDEKISQHYLFDAINAPKIKTWVFWDRQSAVEFIETAQFPLVFKLSVGAGSANVLKLEHRSEALRLIEIMFADGFTPYTVNEFEQKLSVSFPSFYRRLKDSANYLLKRRWPAGPQKPPHWYYLIQKNYIYFQEFLPDNRNDIRVTVIGERIFAYLRYNRDNDFRASGSGNLEYNRSLIPEEALQIASQISKENRFQSMAYDFLVAPEQGLVLSEISYCYVNRLVHDCGGYWDEDLNWQEGATWPEDAILEDFIQSLDKHA
jgi:hypothetical protein